MRNFLARYLLLAVSIFFSASGLIAQDFSNKGKDFWVGYGLHCRMFSGGGGTQEMVLYFATEAVTNITVEIPSLGYTQTYNNIPANTIFTANPIPKAGAQDARLTTEGVSSKGIHITSTMPVVAYAHIYNGNVSGATLLFPTGTLGREYYSMNYTQNSNEANSNTFFYAIATDTGTTTIEVIPSATTQNMIAGQTYTYNLQQGQVFNALGTEVALPNNLYTGTDLTGSVIRSKSVNGVCKKIAVFSGAGKLFIRCGANQNTSADNYMVQAFPKNAWGKNFLTVPTQTMPNNFYRIGVDDPTTVVKLNGVTLTGLINNFYYQIGPVNTPNFIESDKPVMVAQYITTQGSCSNGTPGDPEVIYLSPVEQNINRVILNSTPNSAITGHYLNVVIPNGGTAVSSFRIDGAIPANPFIVHPRNAAYSYLQTPVAVGQHTLQSDSGFNAIAYGFGNAESYGYNAGTNVKDLFQFVTTQNQLAIAPFPAACVNSPFFYSITFPYQPDSIRWTFNGLFPPVGFKNPVPDSTYLISGRTVYTYRIPAPYTITTAGNYPTRVYARNPTGDGCNNDQEIDFTLRVFNPPAPDFSWNSKGCVDSLVTITTNNNTGGRPVIKHFWDFGDNTYAYTDNPTKRFTTPGPHTIRYAVLTDVGCLSDTLEKTIYVTNTPTAKFGFTNPQCQGKNITFGDTSKLTGSYGNIANWNWNLGNGTILNNPNGNNVTTTYPNAIPYNATLQVRTNTGCLSNVYSQPVSVRPNPVVNFSNQYACLPDGVVNFTGLSTIADGTQNLFEYFWNFGDVPGPLNNATSKDPSHKYPSVGPFTVKLIVKSNNGCIDSTSKPVTNIYPQPKVGINAPAEVCYQTPVNFKDQTNGITHPVTRWEWRFKNSTGTIIGSSTLKDPIYNFPSPGTYFVQHWAFTNQNCVSDTLEIPIIINPWPTAALTLSTPACEKNQVTLFDNSTPNAGTLVRWYWNLGDGTIINATNGNPINHTYAAWGNKTVKLLVESSKGCLSDTLPKSILINPLPKIGYVLPEVCLTDGFAIFNDTSNIADGSKAQLKYLWTFNTGAPPVVPAPTPLTSTSKNPTIQFFTAANYQLNLKVESKDGCKDSVNNIPFTVNGVVAKADYKILPTNGLCSNKEVEIQNKSTVVFGWLTKVEIFWDWANNPAQVDVDDVPLVDEIYKHQYPNFQSPATKTYRVRLKAYSGIICQKDTIQDIVVNASPLTKFDPMPGICVDAAPRQITQASELGGLPRLSETYSGPGVNASGLFDPAAAGVGIHTITYTFVATNGCTHSSTSRIEVWPRPTAQLAASLPSCEKNAITFNSNGSQHNAASISNWNWNFGDASTPVNAGNNTPVKHTYANYGNYTVNLTVTNNRGCISLPKPLNITVHPLPRVDFDLPKICLPDGTGQFKNKSSIPDNTQASFQYKWDFGDGFAMPANSDTSSAKDPVYKYRNLGPYTVQLIVISNNNCVDSLPKQLIEVFPQPKARFTAEDSICIGGAIDFTDKSDGIVRNVTKWKWSFGNGDSSFIQNPKYRYPSPATVPYIVTLYVYSEEGCVSDTAQKPIYIWDYPKVSAGPDITMLQEGVRKITDAKATGTGLQYLWTPSTYLDNPQSSNPTIVKPQDDITYTVTVTGRGACTADDEVFVKVLKMPKPPNTFTPNGDGVNDFWEIKYLNDYPGCIVEVYNTAGSLVYRSVGYPTPWDGKFNGQPLPSGTYYYVIDPRNGRSRQAGYVTILK